MVGEEEDEGGVLRREIYRKSMESLWLFKNVGK